MGNIKDFRRGFLCGIAVDESSLRDRLTADVTLGIRSADMIDRSVQRISMYQALDTVKIDTSNRTVREIADEIVAL